MRTTRETDIRVNIMNEIILGIQVIKMYTWEKSFAKIVYEIRNAEAYVSIKRLQDFLLRPEKKYPEKTSEKLQGENTPVAERVQNLDCPEKSIRLGAVTAAWEPGQSQQSNGIFDVNVEINSGLCSIVGQVGSGKSTLLNVILGELDLDMGSVAINGTISYASQDPWLFEGSVRNNIVFVEDFDEQRYSQVVEVCALERDFELLPQGDATIIGEKGSSLSGGQKARVNLARAIYKQADIYLLDDPLSAVDIHVGKYIFTKCIKKFLSNKICVLVTHQLQYLKDEKHVILMNNGKVEAEDENEEEGGKEPAENQDEAKSVKTVHNTDDRKEQQKKGAINLDVYKTFVQSAHSCFFVFGVFVLFIVAQFAWSASDYILSAWVDWEEREMAANSTEGVPEDIPRYTESYESQANNSAFVPQSREVYIYIYSGIMTLCAICYASRAFAFFQMCLRISINLHNQLFRGVSRAKMLFFNNNTSGRILNRFSSDINNVDSVLPNIMFDILEFCLQYLAIVMITAIVNPWLLIPAAIMSLMFYFIRKLFIKTGRSFKRIEAMSRSPVLSHINATLQGLSTIRAFNASELLEKEFHDIQDHNISCYYLFLSSSRWFALWMDLVCLLFISFVTFSFLSVDFAMGSGKVGLAILSSMALIHMCQWGMRQSAEMENQMTSVERIVEYAELPSEPPLESVGKNAPPKDWPSKGNIQFKSLSMRYAEKGAKVLHNLTFNIDAKILIDGIDIGVLALHDLRSKISIIPQEPVLFSGSLRFNLDPLGEKTDAELWSSLEQVEMISVVLALRGGIDTKVSDRGSNFSVGQRQLLCLARAILRNNKILVLDEATANIDSVTDTLIQKTIRNKFGDCKVITIAHRLHTIIDSDRVLVIDAGRCAEFASPSELIQKENVFFKHLLDQTGVTGATVVD
ncbi:putative multidrug resistance-associated protein lethal [Pseudolycoriella hygida]|uniref:Multidrug resistance-associated protein lethal n=1 Tax=Pseudolycoriella hygida TaxID=35572 RepID=A0A9Q0NAM7_9DIPT|nr:putative multidrug resistance-associated protein lethal [Pseudolycoriella hygida]